LNLLDGVGIETVTFAVAGEPTTEVVEQGREVARSAGVDWVLAVGGGAVMDAGKALAALLANQGPVLDYLEVIGKGRALELLPYTRQVTFWLISFSRVNNMLSRNRGSRVIMAPNVSAAATGVMVCSTSTDDFMVHVSCVFVYFISIVCSPLFCSTPSG